MSSLMTNAGFLDGADGWLASAQLNLSVDEATRGGPGRAVLIGAGTTTATNQTQSLACSPSTRAVVSAGGIYEVSASLLALVAGSPVAPSAVVQWYDAGGGALTPTALTVQPAQITSHGEGRFGVRNSYRTVRQKVTAPAGAVRGEIKPSVTPAASGSAVVLGLLKPMIAPVIAARSEPLSWDPGVHVSTDLQLPCWPTELRPFDLGPGGQAQAAVVEFQAGAGRPSMRRTAEDPVRQFNGTVRCDPVERAILEAFWSATPGDFWFVEPDSDRLCLARFAAEGRPEMTEDKGEVVTMKLSLWLETA